MGQLKAINLMKSLEAAVVQLDLDRHCGANSEAQLRSPTPKPNSEAQLRSNEEAALELNLALPEIGMGSVTPNACLSR